MSFSFIPNVNSMKQIILVSMFTIAGFCSNAQTNEAVLKLVKEGIALHDKGDYEGAISKYDVALVIDKDDYDANYEKSLSCLYAKRYDDCIAISKYLLEKHKGNADIKAVYSNCGSAYDDKGDAENAIAMFDKGLKLFPDFYLLHYNKGLTLARLKKWDEAMPCFNAAMKIKPTHAGSLYYSSLAMEKSNKVAAIISGLCFLAVEPEGDRAKNMYEYLFELFNSFAKKEGEKNTTIFISADDLGDKKKENNFSMVNMMLGLTIASSLTDSVKATTDVAKLSLYMQMMASSLSTGQKDGKGIYWKTYAPFLIEMKEKDQMDAFAHIASITSGNDENIKWINDNQDKLQSFYKWMQGYEWKK